MNLNQIGFQLYTCRDLLKTSAEIAKTLKRLRTIGYTAVEACGVSVSDEELGKIIQQEGLVCVASHQDNETILSNPARVLENLQHLGCKLVGYSYPVGVDFGSAQAIQALISNLHRSGEFFKKSGYTLYYHNHQLEFRKLDGKVILERIYEETSPDVLQGELDIYWVQYGGGDICAWIEKLAGRLPLIHLKDYQINAENIPQFCELGAGTLNLPQIIESAEKAGCKWFIVEQDVCPGDPVDSLEQSFRALQAMYS